MKILLVNKFLIPRGGVETYVFDLGKALTNAGHEVEYFGMDEPGRIVGNEWGIYARPMDLHGSQGLSKVFDVARTIDSKDNAAKIAELLEVFRPDIIHFNNIHYHLTPSVIVEAVKYKKRTGKVGIVLTAHDYHYVVPCDGCMDNTSYEICDSCLDGKYSRCIRRRCARGGLAKNIVAAAESYYWHGKSIYKQLDRVICPCSVLKDKYDSLDEFRGRTVHIPNFTNLERCSFPKDRYVLYFGGYYKNKGVGTLLDIAEKHPEIEFRLAGRGDYSERIDSLPNVVDLGFNTGEQLREIIGRATLSVLPTECLENSPFAVLEALCCGTPVLAANVGGVPELLADGVTGELFAFRDAEDLERRLVSLWNDPERCARYAQACVNFEPMSVETYLDLLAKTYEEAILRVQ